ncbi:MAG: hypothetical protein IPF99_33285 [Deltaproteobacteria bacterium]|nr:hypothetical protein [Deltaproteobacteria bacterium]
MARARPPPGSGSRACSLPVGILGELYLGLSPVFVLIGAVAMTASVVLSGVLALRHWSDTAVTSASAAIGTEGARRVRSGAWRWLAGGLAVAFGLATIVEGGSVLLGGPAARAEAGHVVPFVLAFNFAAGFVYVAAGAATLAGRSVGGLAGALALASSTLLVFAAFGVHVNRGEV